MRGESSNENWIGAYRYHISSFCSAHTNVDFKRLTAKFLENAGKYQRNQVIRYPAADDRVSFDFVHEQQQSQPIEPVGVGASTSAAVPLTHLKSLCSLLHIFSSTIICTMIFNFPLHTMHNGSESERNECNSTNCILSENLFLTSTRADGKFGS